jgi:Sterol carrier protein domain
MIPVPDGALAFCRELCTPGRALGAFDADRCVGTFRSLDLEVTGRFAIDARQDGTASVTATSEPADVALDVSALGTLYLGDQTARRLAAAGLVTQRRPGAVADADRMLRTAGRPWCPDGF